MKSLILSMICLMMSANLWAESVRANNSENEGSHQSSPQSQLISNKNAALQHAFSNGSYRETSKNKGCPPGEFQWIENNSQLKIGSTTPTFITLTPKTKRTESVAGTEYIFETETSVNTENNISVHEKYMATTIEDGKTEKQVIVYTLGIHLLPNAKNPKKKNISLSIKEGHKIIKCSYEK